jgi:hypothetical protein
VSTSEEAQAATTVPAPRWPATASVTVATNYDRSIDAEDLEHAHVEQLRNVPAPDLEERRRLLYGLRAAHPSELRTDYGGPWFF